MISLKVNSEFVELPDQPNIVRQVKTFDTDGQGDFSYSFSLTDTTETRRKLGILGLDVFDIPAELVSSAVSIYSGTLSIDNIEDGTIDCSFFAGNTDWFTIIGEKRISEIPVSYTDQYKYGLINTNPSALLVASWTRDSGVVFPLADTGRLSDVSVLRLETTDFMTMVYVRDVLTSIFKSNGIKYDGDLFQDGLFNTLVAGNGSGLLTTASEDNTLPYFNGLAAFVGKSSNQSITTSASKVTFDITTGKYTSGQYNKWDVVNNRWGLATLDISMAAQVNIQFDATVDWTIEYRVNGVTQSTATGSGTSAVKTRFINLDEGEYFEVWLSIDSGSQNIELGSTLRIYPARLLNYYPQFLFGSNTQIDFVNSVFLMFNVIPDYNPITKTLTCNLFENLLSRPVQDLSQYLESYGLNMSDPLSDLGKELILKHQENDNSVEQVSYNSGNPVPFGAGKITIDRVPASGITDKQTIFTASTHYFNEPFRAALMKTDTQSYESSDTSFTIISVADNGSGFARFTTSENHQFAVLDYVRITTASGEYEGLGLVNDVPADNQFDVQLLPFGSTTTGTATPVTRNNNIDDNRIFISSYFPSMAVSNFSNNSTLNYAGTSYANIAWAYFLKQNFNLPIDDLLKSASFDSDSTTKSITLFDSYYRLYIRAITVPILCRCKMLMPENVYRDLNFSQPAMLQTKDFTWYFFIRKIEGYTGSESPFAIDLLKLS